MASLRVSKTKPRWASFMLPMVRQDSSRHPLTMGFMTLGSCLFRRWCPMFPSRRDTVRTTASLVAPLSRLSWHRNCKHCCPCRYLPIPNAGWHAPHPCFCLALIIDTRMLGGNWSDCSRKGDQCDGTFRQIISHKTVNILACFILFYVGIEVTINGS
jgi:hypothetical protein